MKHFALAGNPNCGKTTLFNSLTGSTAHVGNWPGVTVDKKTGTYKKLQEPVGIVDLPGIYSLSPYTPEEIVSRNYILNEKPDAIINIVDATNLERNLYLTTQLLEIDVPVVIALNMADVVAKNGDKLDASILSKKLGVPVVEISALKETGLQELMEVAYKVSETPRQGVSYLENKDLEHLIKDVKIAFEGKGVENPLFHATKLVEMDELETKDHQDLIKMVDDFKATFEDDTFGDDLEALIANARYEFIAKEFAKVVIKAEKKDEGEEVKVETKSDKIDKVLTHRIWGLPLFALIMFLVFHFTFSEDLLFLNRIFGVTIENEGAINFFTGMGYEGEPLEGIPSLGVFLQSWTGWLTGQIISVFQWLCSGFQEFGDVAAEAASATWYGSLICDGILAGLDAVLSFVPQILLMFLFIAIMEDTGYMARIAFILDRAFRKFGLSGKAFIPMLTGFGCSVPAIMGTRTLENETEKNRTIRLITCFSCGAKAPIWAMFAAMIAATGNKWGDMFTFSIYFGGILLAVVFAIFMRVFSSDKYVSPFIMELPAYHAPQARNVGAHLWERLKHYLIKAGTILTASLFVIWMLKSFGVYEGQFGFLPYIVPEDVASIDYSILAYIGQGLKYLFYPCGWALGSDGWKYTVASFTGLVAKEDVVATIGVLFKVPGVDPSEADIGEALAASSGALSLSGIYSFAVFNLLTFPCLAAIATARGEQTKKEFLKTLAFWGFVSYGLSVAVYWIGRTWEYQIWLGAIVTAVVLCAITLAAIFVAKRNKAEAAKVVSA